MFWPCLVPPCKRKKTVNAKFCEGILLIWSTKWSLFTKKNSRIWLWTVILKMCPSCLGTRPYRGGWEVHPEHIGRQSTYQSSHLFRLQQWWRISYLLILLPLLWHASWRCTTGILTLSTRNKPTSCTHETELVYKVKQRTVAMIVNVGLLCKL